MGSMPRKVKQNVMKVNSNQFQSLSGATMNPSPEQTTNAAHASPTPAEEQDAVDSIVPMIPYVLPIVGGVLIFLLAFIAVFLA